MIQLEKWAKFYPDCLPLFAEHHAEIGEMEDRMPLDPDVNMCIKLDEAGLLQIVTFREENKLFGYCIFVIANSLQSKNVLCGTQSLYFLTKNSRHSNIGMKLYTESIKYMKTRGVKNIYPHHWLRGDSPKLKAFFERINATEIEHVYSLWIGE